MTAITIVNHQQLELGVVIRRINTAAAAARVVAIITILPHVAIIHRATRHKTHLVINQQQIVIETDITLPVLLLLLLVLPVLLLVLLAHLLALLVLLLALLVLLLALAPPVLLLALALLAIKVQNPGGTITALIAACLTVVKATQIVHVHLKHQVHSEIIINNNNNNNNN